MKSLTVLLPNYAFAKAAEEADELGVPMSALCANVLADHFLPDVPVKIPAIGNVVRTNSANNEENAAQLGLHRRTRFDVALHFPGFPRGSVELAQAFCDEALDLFPPSGFSEIVAARDGRAIRILPNFVRIEYVMSKGGKTGIGVSFYGEPHRHTSPPSILVKGLPSYSRAKIYSKADLALVLPHVKQAFELKYGPIADPVAN